MQVCRGVWLTLWGSWVPLTLFRVSLRYKVVMETVGAPSRSTSPAGTPFPQLLRALPRGPSTDTPSSKELPLALKEPPYLTLPLPSQNVVSGRLPKSQKWQPLCLHVIKTDCGPIRAAEVPMRSG